MTHYCGIDLHSNNHVVVVIDEADKRVYEKRLNNDLNLTMEALAPYRKSLHGIAVESTFNWYWLVDGLQDAGFQLKLVNTAAVKQYDGLKYSDDQHDAFWLALPFTHKSPSINTPGQHESIAHHLKIGISLPDYLMPWRGIMLAP